MEHQVREDGCHIQNCPTYHHGTARAFFNVYYLARELGLDVRALFGDDWLKKVERMFEFSVLTSTPSFRNVPIGDSGTVRISEAIGPCLNEFKRDDFTFVASGGRKGARPEKTSVALKSSGHLVFRSGWDRDARFMLFDMAEQVGCHSHDDAFNIHVSAYGRELISDSGRTTYQPDEKKKMVKTSRHNTVTVDGMDQENIQPRLIAFSTEGNWGFTHARAKNYPGVEHSRSIIFLRGEHWVVLDYLSSGSEHEYVSNFHTHQRVGLDGDAVIMPNMVLLPVCDSEFNLRLENVVIGRDYGREVRGKAVRVEGAKRKNVKFAALLATYPSGSSAPACSLVPGNFSGENTFLTAVINGEKFDIRVDFKKSACRIETGKDAIEL